MRLVPQLVWKIADSGTSLDPRLLPLLEAIAATGSLSAAVAACGLSYRAAWGLLRDSVDRNDSSRHGDLVRTEWIH